MQKTMADKQPGSHLFHRIFLLLTGVMLLCVGGCATKQTPPLSEADNPLHHYSVGMQAIDANNLTLAMEKFNRALVLDNKFAPALAGKSLLMALQATGQATTAHRQVDTKESIQLLKQARSAADGKAEKFIVHTTAIRVNFVAKPEFWQDETKQHYRAALAIGDFDQRQLPYYQSRDAADYFMAIAAYRHHYPEAEPYLRKVLGAKNSGKWQVLANSVYNKLQKITRLTANRTLSNKVEQIAVKDSVSRGDIAVLLADELRLNNLFSNKLTAAGKNESRGADFTPHDIIGHPFQNEIQQLLGWGVRGFTARYDAGSRSWLYDPQSTVSRKEFALALEDLLIKLSGDESLATAMIGFEKSPFPDVPAGVAWFNAVMTVTSRNLMTASLNGEFKPNAPVDGADSLTAIFKLRHLLQGN